MENTMRIPEHVAMILDGNGRWAKKRGLPRQMGHKEGCETLEQVVEDAARIGIRYLTVYGFSTENWKRPEAEVGALMQLFRFYAKRLLKIAKEHDVRVKMIGERNRFDTGSYCGHQQPGRRDEGRQRHDLHYRRKLRRPGRNHKGRQARDGGCKGRKAFAGGDG